MPDTNNKRAALIAEGLSEGEADFMVSGGTKPEGLTPPVADDAAAPAAPAKTSVEVHEAGEQPAKAGAAQPAQQPAIPPVDDEAEDDPAKVAAHPQIPYAQFRREEKARKALQKELKARDEALAERDRKLAEGDQRWARLDERLQVFREANEQQAAAEQPKPPAPPDPEADPIGYLKYLGEKVSGLDGKTDQVATTVQERDAATALESTYVADARQFVARQPDFGQAYAWLMNNRDAELSAAGYTDPAERSRIILADERDIVARAVQARRSNPQAAGPTQILYGLAKARGYMPAPAATPAVPNNGAAQTNGAVAQPSVTAQVEAIQRGQAASRSLSSGGGAPAPAALDLSRLADMNDAEYLEFKRNMTPTQRAELNALMGAPGR
jgi:hypothetical protein